MADSYDAMSSRRIYRSALSRDVIYEEIRKNRGLQFDPEITDIFLKLMDESGRSSWELLQNCYCIKDCHEQKIPLVLALTSLPSASSSLM